jgi:hypothetical protein
MHGSQEEMAVLLHFTAGYVQDGTPANDQGESQQKKILN